MKKYNICYYFIVGAVMLLYLFICYYTTTTGSINLIIPYVYLGIALVVLSVAHKKFMRDLE